MSAPLTTTAPISPASTNTPVAVTQAVSDSAAASAVALPAAPRATTVSPSISDRVLAVNPNLDVPTTKPATTTVKTTVTDNATAAAAEASVPAEDPRAQIKDSNVARDAFRNRDVELSKKEHAKRTVEEGKTAASEYIKAIVFGGLDGINTTFAIVTAAAGSNDDWRTVLVFGFANAIADAFAMGFGETVSGMAELDLGQSEHDREMWEIEHELEEEKEEMIQLFQLKGISEEDSKTLVEIYAKDKNRFCHLMMVHELGLLIDFEDRWAPMKQGVVMFCSFATFAMFPIVPYLSGMGKGADGVFAVACVLTAIGMLTLGAIKGYLIGLNIAKAAVEMLIQGCLSGAISFILGVIVNAALSAKFGTR